MTPKELAGVCDDVLAAYVKGDLRGRLDSKGNLQLSLAGQRRRRPALVSLESGDNTPEPVLDAGSVELGSDDSDQLKLVPIDFCGLEEYVVREEADGVTLVFLWVSSYPVLAPSPGLGIPAVDFTDDVGSLGLSSQVRVVPPSNSFEPGSVVNECMFAVQAALGEEWQTHAIESRLVLCRFEDLLTTRQAVIDGRIT